RILRPSRRSRSQTTGLENADKEVNDRLDKLNRVFEHWENRLTIQRLSLPEHYVEGRINLVLGFLLVHGTIGSKEYRAVSHAKPEVFDPGIDRLPVAAVHE